MNQLKRMQSDIDYLTEQENENLALANAQEKHSEDYNYYQKLFGIYFRARILTTRALEDAQKGEARGSL